MHARRVYMLFYLSRRFGRHHQRRGNLHTTRVLFLATLFALGVTLVVAPKIALCILAALFVLWITSACVRVILR